MSIINQRFPLQRKTLSLSLSPSSRQIIVCPSSSTPIGTTDNPIIIEDDSPRPTFAGLRLKGHKDNYATKAEQEKYIQGGYKRPPSKYQAECEAEFKRLSDKEKLKLKSPYEDVSASEYELKKNLKKRKRPKNTHIIETSQETDIATSSRENSQEEFPPIILKQLDTEGNPIILHRPLIYEENQEKYREKFPSLNPIFTDKTRSKDDLRYIVFPMIRLSDDEIIKPVAQTTSNSYLRFAPYNFINQPDFLKKCPFNKNYFTRISINNSENIKITLPNIFKIWIIYQNTEREKQGIPLIESYNPKNIKQDIKNILSDTIKIINKVFNINEKRNDNIIKKLCEYDWSLEKKHSIKSLLGKISEFFEKTKSEPLNETRELRNPTQLRILNPEEVFKEPSIDIKIKDKNELLTRGFTLEENKKTYGTEFPPLELLFTDTQRTEKNLRYIVFPLILLTQKEINMMSKSHIPEIAEVVPYNFYSQKDFIEYSEKNTINSLLLQRNKINPKKIIVEKQSDKPFTLYFIFQMWINYQNKEREKQAIPLIESYNTDNIAQDIKNIISETVEATQHIFLIKEMKKNLRMDYSDLIKIKNISQDKERSVEKLMRAIVQSVKYKKLIL